MSQNTKSNTPVWYKAKVIRGKKIGRTLGFPTINLDHPALLKNYKEGVYACRVDFDNKVYNGLLYYGPRLILKEKNYILEIFVDGLNQEIYGQEISFELVKFIRGVMNFADFSGFKKQLEVDFGFLRQILLK